MKGFFISMEGSDGSGKSTQLKNIEKHLEARGYRVLVTREPGGTAVSEKIRDILLDPENTTITPWTEMFLYAAARAQHLEECILPALAKGKIVLCDRFVDSSIAYQGYGRELGDVVRQVNEIVTKGIAPDLTFFLDLPPHEGMERKRSEDGHKMDRLELEKESFHTRVYNGYLAQCKEDKNRIVHIDARGSAPEVFCEIQKILDTCLVQK